MNALEKLDIEHMRNEGLSYAVIAQKLGLSKASVKSYCVRHDLGGKRATSGHPHVPNMENRCEECGCIVVQRVGRKHKRFCCYDCRMKWWTKYRAANRTKETAGKQKKNKQPVAVPKISEEDMSDSCVQIILPHEEPVRVIEKEHQWSTEQFVAEYVYYVCRIVLREMLIKGIVEEDERGLVLSVLIDIFMPPISSICLNTPSVF